MTPLTFVTYHTDLSEKAIAKLYEKYPLFKEQHWEKYFPLSKQCIELMFKSVKLIHKNCRCILISDVNTTFENMKDVEVIRFDVDPDKPAYMRMIAQIKFLKNHSTTHVVFLDYDMLVQQELSHLFESNFDIGLTYRMMYQGKFCPCPINGGLIFIHKEHIEQATRFLETVKIAYQKSYSKNEDWGGFQGAINDVIGDSNIFSKKTDIITVNDTKILLLPVDEYNFTIQKKPELIEYMPNKKILHFKGPRKDDMLIYWNEYLRPRK